MGAIWTMDIGHYCVLSGQSGRQRWMSLNSFADNFDPLADNFEHFLCQIFKILTNPLADHLIATLPDDFKVFHRWRNGYFHKPAKKIFLKKKNQIKLKHEWSHFFIIKFFIKLVLELCGLINAIRNTVLLFLFNLLHFFISCCPLGEAKKRVLFDSGAI